MLFNSHLFSYVYIKMSELNINNISNSLKHVVLFTISEKPRITQTLDCKILWL
jgi:hypothetical protein